MGNHGLLVNNPADRDEATQWFFRAALLGNTDGMLLLSGILQEQGDHAVAQNWLQKAADLGGPRAAAGAGDRDTRDLRVRSDQGRSEVADASSHVHSAAHRVGGDRSTLGDLVGVTGLDDAPPDLGATDVEGKERSHEDPYEKSGV